VFDVEIARLGPQFKLDQCAPFLETAAELKARAILVAGDDPDEARLTDSFAAFCRAAPPCGLTANLEFMPWTAVKDARTALRIVTNASEPNGRVLVDTLHAARSATTLDDIARLPRHLLSYAQLCDAPVDIPTTHNESIHTARCARLLPGEGGIDLVGLARALPDDLPFSLEIPNAEWLPKIGAEEWSRRALACLPTQQTIVMERFFDEAGGMQLVIHSPYGSRINRAWGLALRNISAFAASSTSNCRQPRPRTTSPA
jgi:sugar phosphate isomerase/epimerase